MENMNIQRPVSIYLCGYDSESGGEFISVPHAHHFHQMNLVHAGYVDFETDQGSRRLLPGDIVLVPPGQTHCLRPENHCGFRTYSFKFFLPEKSLNLPKTVVFTEPELRKQQLEWIRGLGCIFSSVAPPDLFQSSQEFSLAADTPGIELLESLIWGFCRRIDIGESSSDSWILRKLKLFVQSGCGKPVSVAECARHLHCSPGYLRTLILKETGRTTKEIIDLERIRIARRLLVYSDISISALASRMKFNDLIYFDKFFRKYTGETPRGYRKTHRAESMMEHADE